MSFSFFFFLFLPAIGVVFVLPGLYFAARGQIPRDSYRRLLLLGAMGGGQGLVGWWMVKSGLEHTHVFGIERSVHDTPRVSPYRLTTHLGMAFATYGLLTWTAMDLWRRRVITTSTETLAAAASNVSNAGFSPTQALRRLRTGEYSV